MVLLICVAGGWYAKGNLVDGIIFGWIAPLLLVPVWYVMLFAVSIPFELLGMLMLRLTQSVIEHFAKLPEVVAYGFHPVTILTGILFGSYCRVERENNLPSSTIITKAQSSNPTPFSRPFRR